MLSSSQTRLDFENKSEFSVHYWGTYAKNLLKGSLKPEYRDPKDNKSLFVATPAPRMSPAMSIFTLDDVIC